jgi:hypothetical protein
MHPPTRSALRAERTLGSMMLPLLMQRRGKQAASPTLEGKRLPLVLGPETAPGWLGPTLQLTVVEEDQGCRSTWHGGIPSIVRGTPVVAPYSAFCLVSPASWRMRFHVMVMGGR